MDRSKPAWWSPWEWLGPVHADLPPESEQSRTAAAAVTHRRHLEWWRQCLTVRPRWWCDRLHGVETTLSPWYGCSQQAMPPNITSHHTVLRPLASPTRIYTIKSIAEEADKLLFRKIMSANHCIHFLLPSVKSIKYCLRHKGHPYELPRCEYELHKKSFIPRCLYRNS